VLVLMSVPFLGQKLNLKGLSTLLVGFAGVYLIAAQGQPWPLQPAEPFGVILAISTSVIWAGFWIINTKSAVDPVVNLFLNFSTGFLLSIPLALIIPWDYHVPMIAWAAVLYSGFFEMGITFVIWLTAMKLTERTDKISNYVFLSPFISLFFIRMVLKEHIYLTTLLIISSIFLNRWVNKKAIK